MIDREDTRVTFFQNTVNVRRRAQHAISIVAGPIADADRIVPHQKRSRCEQRFEGLRRIISHDVRPRPADFFLVKIDHPFDDDLGIGRN